MIFMIPAPEPGGITVASQHFNCIISIEQDRYQTIFQNQSAAKITDAFIQ